MHDAILHEIGAEHWRASFILIMVSRLSNWKLPLFNSVPEIWDVGISRIQSSWVPFVSVSFFYKLNLSDKFYINTHLKELTVVRNYGEESLCLIYM